MGVKVEGSVGVLCVYQTLTEQHTHIEQFDGSKVSVITMPEQPGRALNERIYRVF